MARIISIDMKEKVEEATRSMQKLEEEFPRQREAFGRLMTSAMADGAIPAKYKYLIAVALAVASHCEWCIGLNTMRALKAGATRQEILEACWVAVYMGAGPNLTFTQEVMQALEDFKE